MHYNTGAHGCAYKCTSHYYVPAHRITMFLHIALLCSCLKPHADYKADEAGEPDMLSTVSATACFPKTCNMHTFTSTVLLSFTMPCKTLEKYDLSDVCLLPSLSNIWQR